MFLNFAYRQFFNFFYLKKTFLFQFSKTKFRLSAGDIKWAVSERSSSSGKWQQSISLFQPPPNRPSCALPLCAASSLWKKCCTLQPLPKQGLLQERGASPFPGTTSCTRSQDHTVRSASQPPHSAALCGTVHSSPGPTVPLRLRGCRNREVERCRRLLRQKCLAVYDSVFLLLPLFTDIRCLTFLRSENGGGVSEEAEQREHPVFEQFSARSSQQ